MFNKQNFCHVASNNRNEKKAGIFVYKTTDNLATVSASGYFNEKIIDLNLHDLIIHEQTDNADRTKVKYNYLAVTERTLDNVGTTVIKRDLDITIEQAIADLQTYVDATFVRKDGTSIMTGPLLMRATADFKCAIAPYWDGIGFFKLNDNNSVTLMGSLEYRDSFTPAETNIYNIGTTTKKWKNLHLAGVLYTSAINNGYNISVPVTNSADTLALKSQVDDAANSGEQLYTTGVWYAKMYAATVVPSGVDYDGKNYADFSQTNNDGDPIIVIYEGQSGAWVQIATITPPANHNGYITITSKIWDIVEQDGQQGGQVLWSHNQKTFTPYPKIISFKDAHLTGNSTTDMPAQPTGQTIVNVDYLSNHTGSGKNVGDVFFTMRNDNALSGAVECNGATYNTEDFVGTGSISGLLSAGKIPYVSLAQYETLLTTQGSVGVFGWDGGNTTAFRVPSLNDIFVETGTAAQIGDYIAPGAPDIQGTFDAKSNDGTATGAFTSTLLGSDKGWQGDWHNYRFTFKASDSNSVYGNSATIQPNTVRYRAMVQLATGATDEALETCTQVLADVAANTAAIAGADYVVETQLPTAQNNYTWYRKYKSGWVEQGGIGTTTSGNALAVVFPIVMSDANYTLNVTGQSPVSTTASTIHGCHYTTKTATGCSIICLAGNSGNYIAGNVSWEVKGIAA